MNQSVAQKQEVGVANHVVYFPCLMAAAAFMVEKRPLNMDVIQRMPIKQELPLMQ
jgi:hypothetical protein